MLQRMLQGILAQPLQKRETELKARSLRIAVQCPQGHVALMDGIMAVNGVDVEGGSSSWRGRLRLPFRLPSSTCFFPLSHPLVSTLGPKSIAQRGRNECTRPKKRELSVERDPAEG